MVADELEYGWYKWEDGCRQGDGLFVDRFDRVIYWPEAEGPGYILDDATAEKIPFYRKIEKEKNKNATLSQKTKKKINKTINNKNDKDDFSFYLLAFIVLFYRFVLIFLELFALFVKEIFLPGGDDSSGAPSIDAVAGPAEDDEIDLSRYPQIAGPRPIVQDDLIVAKAMPGLVFSFQCLGLGALSAGAAWLFSSMVLYWGWGGAGHIFWGIVLGLLLLSLAVHLSRTVRDMVRRRYSPIRLDYLISRIKVRDGLTLDKLSRKEDGAGDTTAAGGLEYGWFKWKDGFRQKDGLFVDRMGRAIFWPDAKGPGYILDDATAEKIGGGQELKVIADRIASSNGAAEESAEGGQIDLSDCPKVVGRRPAARDRLIVAKAMPDLAFFLQCLWRGVASAGLAWLSYWILWGLSWQLGGAAMAWRIVGGVFAFIGAGLLASETISRIGARYSPNTLDYLISRIKVRDGLTLPKLSREKDSTLDVDIPPELQRHEDANTRRMRDFDRL